MTSTAEEYGFGPKRVDDASEGSAAERTMSLPPMPPEGASTAGFPAASVFTPIAPSQPSDFFDDAENTDGDFIRVRHRKGHRTAWIVALGLLALLIALVAGSLAAGHVYFQQRAAPGVSLGATSVTGKNAQELKTLVHDAVSRSTIVISDGQGNTAKASLTDLGVKVDETATVNKLLQTKGGNVFRRLNPFDTTRVPLVATTNKLVSNDYVANAFVKQSDRAVASSIAYDSTAKQFVATEGRGGKLPVAQPVNSAVDRLVSNPGASTTVAISYRHVDMPISLQSARTTADDANARLAQAITITAGETDSFTIPAERVAAWITPTGDPATGHIALQYDSKAIDDYLNTELPNELNRKMVTQQDVVDGKGAVLLTKVKGIDGVAVKNVASLSTPIYQALSNAQNATIKVDADVTAHDVKQIVSRYRIVVDKSTQIATVYEGDSVVKTFQVCTGKSGSNESDSGTFAIYLRYNTQDMRGTNDDGTPYLSKGVRWVSYYNGGEGFHTASWNYSGIARGDPSDNGSHGCVNMYEQDAQWIYDNCPEGTLVTVTGNQPTGPVR